MIDTQGPLFKWLKRLGTMVVIGVVAFLVYREAREIDWPEVLSAVREYGMQGLVIAFGLALPGLLACACFDLIGKHATNHGLPTLRVMLISFTGYFFSLNLGALIGGLAFRYRLYAPYGLAKMKIGQIIGLSVLTNWSGYVFIAGVVLSVQPPDLPPDWGPGTAALRAIGVALLAVAAAYLTLCALKGGTIVSWRGSDLRLPKLRVAFVQLGLSMLSWGAIGAILTWLLPGEVSWFAVMPVLMMSAIAGIWSHVPGGLGVTEVVFLTLLGHLVDRNTVLGAVLAFRVVYYIVPFALAAAIYLYLESTAHRLGRERASTGLRQRQELE